MKKKNKIILCVSILLIITIVVLAFYLLCQLEQYTLVINSIEDDTIIASHCVMVDKNNEPLAYKYYTFSFKDIFLKDSVDISTLKVGDTIYVLTMKPIEKLDIAYSVEPLSNVILVNLLDNSNKI